MNTLIKASRLPAFSSVSVSCYVLLFYICLKYSIILLLAIFVVHLRTRYSHPNSVNVLMCMHTFISEYIKEVDKCTKQQMVDMH